MLWKKGTHFVRILFTKLPLILPAGHRPSAICAPVRQRVSELPPRDLAMLPIACAVDQTPVGPRSDACTLTLPTCDPGPGPGPILTSAQLRQRGMHLSADEKKRKAEAHGYSTMLATRGRTSLLKAILALQSTSTTLPRFTTPSGPARSAANEAAQTGMGRTVLHVSRQRVGTSIWCLHTLSTSAPKRTPSQEKKKTQKCQQWQR